MHAMGMELCPFSFCFKNKNMLTSAPEHCLKNYKKEFCLENCVFHFLKVKKVLFSIQNLIFHFTFGSLTSAPEALVNKTLKNITKNAFSAIKPNTPLPSSNIQSLLSCY